MESKNETKIHLKIQRFCPHCNNSSIQDYLLHHFYDQKQGGLWDGEVKTVQEPGASFVFLCKICEQVLLYEFCFLTPPDEEEIEGFLSYYEHNGVRDIGWEENEIKSNLELVWPQLYEEVHNYVPLSVKKYYLKALKNVRSPELFAIEIRKALEAICTELNITDNSLVSKLEKLCKVAMLPESIRAATHRLRLTGNEAAHGGVDPKDIPLIRNFFRVLINHIFVLPLQSKEWDSLNPDLLPKLEKIMKPSTDTI